MVEHPAIDRSHAHPSERSSSRQAGRQHTTQTIRNETRLTVCYIAARMQVCAATLSCDLLSSLSSVRSGSSHLCAPLITNTNRPIIVCSNENAVHLATAAPSLHVCRVNPLSVCLSGLSASLSPVHMWSPNELAQSTFTCLKERVRRSHVNRTERVAEWRRSHCGVWSVANGSRSQFSCVVPPCVSLTHVHSSIIKSRRPSRQVSQGKK
mmetsp:Transcript_24930/g.71933  ORF Transcript_24930/g.71933 Transcript_24930/m.71933 type:complete len:209 (-) Transcript_24930:924-1550(-)